MNYDQYFMGVCDAVAKKSPCLSQKIGAILVWDKRIVSTGYNGPPRDVPHCLEERLERDNVLQDALLGMGYEKDQCPRKILGFKSGEGLEFCPAVHAEVNCIATAATAGHFTHWSTMYVNSIIPCRECLKVLINAGVHEIVVKDKTFYDIYSRFLISTTRTIVRECKDE